MARKPWTSHGEAKAAMKLLAEVSNALRAARKAMKHEHRVLIALEIEWLSTFENFHRMCCDYAAAC
jgi:hypothetical protein